MKGSAVVHTSPEQAAEQARLDALGKALTRVCGTRVKGLSTLRNTNLVQHFMAIENLGILIKEEKIRPDVIRNVSDRPDLPPAVMCESWYKFCIKCETREDDPHFVLDLQIKGVNFIEGEELITSAECSKDAYLYLFCMDASNDTYLLFPNSYHEDNRILAEKVLEIPNAKDREFPGIHFRLSPGNNKLGRPRTYSSETIVAVATKEKQPLVGLGDEFDFGTHISIRKMKFTDFSKWLTRIAPKNRTMEMAGYTIFQRDKQIMK